MLKILKSELGMSPLMLLVAVSVSTALLIPLLSTAKMLTKQSTKSTTMFAADQMRRNITAFLVSDTASSNTVNDTANTSLDCVRTGSDCSTASGSFRLRDAANNIVFDPASSTSGFSVEGSPCTFDAANGSNSCPFRLTLSWAPLCGTSCVNPQMKITGTFEYKPSTLASTVVFNTQKYSLEVIRPATGAYTCTTIEGNLSGSSANMVAETLQVDCPTGTRIAFAAVSFSRADAPNTGGAPTPINEQICACSISGNGMQVLQQLRFSHIGKGCSCRGLCLPST